MNKSQRRRLDSYQEISTHFSDHPDPWAGKQPVEEVIAEWDGLLDEVRQREEEQVRDTTGATRTKDQQVDHVVGLAMTVAKRLRSYARLRGDAGLLPAVDFSETELHVMNDGEMVAELAGMTRAARERPPEALAPFEVTPSLLDALDAEAQQVLPKEERQAAVSNARTTATTALRTLFSRFPTLRDSLDDLVDAVIEDEAFRAGYYQARKVRG